MLSSRSVCNINRLSRAFIKRAKIPNYRKTDECAAACAERNCIKDIFCKIARGEKKAPDNSKIERNAGVPLFQIRFTQKRKKPKKIIGINAR